MTPEEKNIELEKRITDLEAQVSVLKHTLAMKDIIKGPYPSYIPWTTPTPVESMFTPSKWQYIEIKERNKN
jgi:hypothetical protein